MTLSGKFYGTKRRIPLETSLELKCKDGEHAVGMFHTHPIDDPYAARNLSYGDVRHAIDMGYEFSCVGYKLDKDKHITCYKYPYGYPKDIADMEKDLYEDVRKYLDIKNKEYVPKSDIPKSVIKRLEERAKVIENKFKNLPVSIAEIEGERRKNSCTFKLDK